MNVSFFLRCTRFEVLRVQNVVVSFKYLGCKLLLKEKYTGTAKKYQREPGGFQVIQGVT